MPVDAHALTPKNTKGENMNEWLNNCNKKTLLTIIQAVRKIPDALITFDNANRNFVTKYKYMKDNVILEKLINNKIPISRIIKHIKNPPKEIQLAAVNQDGFSIGYIRNPSIEIQLAAVNQNGDALEFIKYPSEEVQLAAIKQDSLAIRFIKNPSEKVQLAAVKQYGWAIEYIENPSEEVQLAAVKQDNLAIRLIKNPSVSLLRLLLLVPVDAHTPNKRRIK